MVTIRKLQTTQEKIDAIYSIYSSEHAMENFSVDQMHALEAAMVMMGLDDEYRGIMARARRHANYSSKLFVVAIGVFLYSVFFAVFAN